MSLRITGAPTVPTSPVRRPDSMRETTDREPVPERSSLSGPAEGTAAPAAPTGLSTAAPVLQPDEAAAAAERLARQVAAYAPQAARAHGSLVPSTVLNLLA